MIIGLTGGLGCGKSTAAKIFSQLGFKTLDSDVLVQELYSSDPSVKTAIEEHFGKKVIQQNGQIDRQILAKCVFQNKQDLNWLEDLLHPKVKLLREKYIAQAPKAPWIVEIPLLFEKNLETEFDVIICLSAKIDLQLSRLTQKGISPDDAKSRIVCQMPLEQKEKRADYVIHNNGNIDALHSQINLLVQTLNKRFAS